MALLKKVSGGLGGGNSQSEALQPSNDLDGESCRPASGLRTRESAMHGAWILTFDRRVVMVSTVTRDIN